MQWVIKTKHINIIWRMYIYIYIIVNIYVIFSALSEKAHFNEMMPLSW